MDECGGIESLRIAPVQHGRNYGLRVKIPPVKNPKTVLKFANVQTALGK